MYFLVADIMMDGFNMRRADGTAAIAFETPGAMQDSEERWPSVTQGGCTWGGRARRARDQGHV